MLFTSVDRVVHCTYMRRKDNIKPVFSSCGTRQALQTALKAADRLKRHKEKDVLCSRLYVYSTYMDICAHTHTYMHTVLS